MYSLVLFFIISLTGCNEIESPSYIGYNQLSNHPIKIQPIIANPLQNNNPSNSYDRVNQPNTSKEAIFRPVSPTRHEAGSSCFDPTKERKPVPILPAEYIALEALLQLSQANS